MRTRHYGGEEAGRGGEMIYAMWAIAIWTSVIVGALSAHG